MVRAYELESKAAIYPRVVIDPAVLNQVREDPLLRRHGYGGDEEIADIRKMIERGENGFWYVDYLRTMLGELDDPDHWPEVLKLHKQMIIRRYADKESRTASLDKLLWLAIYQNKLVSKITKSNFEEFGLRRGDFEVRTSELSELARMPKRARAKK